ncbi:hypothetical protein ALC62_04460 [Cyphomyrmex costatus]|uniref:Transposable element Tc3 transposase n=1 Tax=Cyphomyrmex costatus TaxID=456900 RepID=A0A151IK67_9HYME|nr:hypothetical protein ALC62_04460 [Cyphomyrmex costatus]
MITNEQRFCGRPPLRGTFPEREQHPGVHTILKCIYRFRQTGSVLQNRRHEGIINIRVDAEERILRAFEENPRSSIRRVGHTLGLQIGPFFFPPRLTGQTYAGFLENELPILLEDVPLREREELIFQHDGAPAHFSRLVRDVLDTRYPDRWMGRGGPIIWPARSPDLNVLDYFVWGYVKDLVEHIRDGTEAEAREAILAAFNTITPEMAHRATRNITRRAELCLRERGRHFEQFLH